MACPRRHERAEEMASRGLHPGRRGRSGAPRPCVSSSLLPGTPRGSPGVDSLAPRRRRQADALQNVQTSSFPVTVGVALASPRLDVQTVLKQMFPELPFSAQGNTEWTCVLVLVVWAVTSSRGSRDKR